MPAEEWYPRSKTTHEEKIHIYRIAHLMRLTDIHFLAEQRLFSDVGYAGELCGTKPERDWEFRCFGVLDNRVLCFCLFVSYLPIFILWFPFFYSPILFCLQPFYFLSLLWYLFLSRFVTPLWCCLFPLSVSFSKSFLLPGRHPVGLYLLGVLGAKFLDLWLGMDGHLCFCVLDFWYFKRRVE